MESFGMPTEPDTASPRVAQPALENSDSADATDDDASVDDSEGDLACPICGYPCVIYAAEHCEHYLCIRDDDSGDFTWFPAGVTDFNDAVDSLVTQVEEAHSEGEGIDARAMARASAEQRQLFAAAYNNREYWVTHYDGVEVDWYTTYGFPASAVKVYFHADPTTFAVRVKEGAQEGLAALAQAREAASGLGQDESAGQEDAGCPICGDVVGNCGHYLCWDSDLHDFAGGAPAKLAELLAVVAESKDAGVLEGAPDDLRALFARAVPPRGTDPKVAYWADEEGVVTDVFDGGTPAGNGTFYWHEDPHTFEAAVQDEAGRGIAWLQEHVPTLRETTAADNDNAVADHYSRRR